MDTGGHAFSSAFEKLGQFYRYHFGRPAVPTKAVVNPFAALLGHETVLAPRHSSVFNMYRKLYCPEHVAPFFAAHFKIEEDRYAALSEDERAQTKKLSGIGFCTKMYHEYFKQE
ncbi:hypothetical protein FIBSPDRAFT_887747 [Athelia psychrophila]|uniref:Uncharacterized protein n=1 Tax=Athelia psychrophila TaxID=1759441 RepID=A0A166P6S3_9AGAM|nr:hypothetical protein FIBSPDRAFT_887747 [Fibularhizoctonia sp. CBS 109695]